MPPSFKRDEYGNLIPERSHQRGFRDTTVRYERDVDCYSCNGTGRAKSFFLRRDIKCPSCNGTGFQTETVEYQID